MPGGRTASDDIEVDVAIARDGALRDDEALGVYLRARIV